MKSFARNFYLLSILVFVLGIFSIPTNAQIINPQSGNTSADKQLFEISKKAGVFNDNGQSYDPGTGASLTFFGGGKYYISDGKGMLLQYSLGADGQFEHVATGNQDDYLINAITFTSTGEAVSHIPSTDIQSANSKEETFINQIAQQEKLTYDNTKSGSYFESVISASNLSYYQNEKNPVQNLDEQKSLQNRINVLTEEAKKYPQGSDEYNMVQARITELRDKQKGVIKTGQGIEKALGDKINQSAATGAGLSACFAIFNPTDWSSSEQKVLGCIAGIFNFFIELFSFLLILSAALFDFVINFTINQFANNYKQLEGGINTVWMLIKNLSNLVFIGMLLYIAINTILKGDGFGEKKLLGNVIIMAILINFSLLFTKLFIDMSNYVTTEIYAGITKSTTDQQSASITLAGKAISSAGLAGNVDTGLSSAFLNQMKITNVYGNSGQAISAGNIVTNGLLAIIFILVATFVFAAAAVMFLVRFLTLIVLLMTSPIAYVGKILPNASGAANDWWKHLKDNCVFAPVFMIMVYVSLQMLVFVNVAIKDGTGNWVQTSVNYILTITSMIMCLVVAKSAGGHAGAADWGTSLSKNLMGKVAFGAPARLARFGIGGASNALANSGTVRNWASRRGLVGVVGRTVEKSAKRGAEATFDVRNSAAGKAMGAGQGLKEGFAKNRATTEKFIGERLKLLAEGTEREKQREALADYHEKLEKEHNKLAENLEKAEGTVVKKDAEIKEKTDTKNKLEEVKKEIDKKKEELTVQLDTQNTVINDTTGKHGDDEVKAAIATRSKIQAQMKDLEEKKVKEGVDRIATLDAEITNANKEKEAAKKIIDETNKADEKTGKSKISKAKEELDKATARLGKAGYGPEKIEEFKKEVKTAKEKRGEALNEYIEHMLDSSWTTKIATIGEDNTARNNALAKYLKESLKNKDKNIEKVIKELNKVAGIETKEADKEDGGGEEKRPKDDKEGKKDEKKDEGKK